MLYLIWLKSKYESKENKAPKGSEKPRQVRGFDFIVVYHNSSCGFLEEYSLVLKILLFIEGVYCIKK